eukprot:1246253-Prorocentrum_lima.AAC.1
MQKSTKCTFLQVCARWLKGRFSSIPQKAIEFFTAIEQQMGSPGDRHLPDPGDQGIQAGNQQQQPEVPEQADQALHAREQEQQWQRPVMGVFPGNGVGQDPPGLRRPQPPNQMA